MSKDNELLIDEVNNEQEANKEEKKKQSKKIQKKEKEQIKEKTATPFLFFKKDNKIEISVQGYHSKETGQFQFALLSDSAERDDESLDKLFTRVTYKFWFSRVPYNKLNRYRSRSMIYNSEDQNNTINELQLREFFLVYHLVDWNLKDENGDKVPIKFDPNGSLSDETLELIYSLPSSLIDVVLTSYERKAVIS